MKKQTENGLNIQTVEAFEWKAFTVEINYWNFERKYFDL